MHSFEILTYTLPESYSPAVKNHIAKHYNIKSISHALVMSAYCMYFCVINLTTMCTYMLNVLYICIKHIYFLCVYIFIYIYICLYIWRRHRDRERGYIFMQEIFFQDSEKYIVQVFFHQIVHGSCQCS